MLITVGKHKDKSIELIVLKEPSYVNWLLEERGLTGILASFKPESPSPNYCF
jgi:hypothetical protein